MLVHEDIEVLGGICDSLVSEGFKLGMTTCGETALRILENHDFDVVVVSASMPSGGENRLFAVLQHRYPQLPLVLLADEDIEDGRTLAPKVFAYLIQPFDTHQISVLSHVAIDSSMPTRA